MLHCFHASCEQAVREINREFQGYRSELPCEPLKQSEQSLAQREETRQLRVTMFHARQFILPDLRRNKVTEQDWLRASPYPVADVPIDYHWKLFISALFQPSRPHYIWAGERWESGPDYTDNFKTREEWLKTECCPGQQVGTFLFLRANGYRRSDNLLYRVLQVVECDPDPATPWIPNREEFGGVIQWTRQYMRLLAIVDTGGKSWHAAFEALYPPRCVVPSPPGLDAGEAADMAWRKAYGAAWKEYWRLCDHVFPRRRKELLTILEGLGADPKMLQHNYTMRLPGADRLDDRNDPTGRKQRLIYLDPKYEVWTP